MIISASQHQTKLETINRSERHSWVLAHLLKAQINSSEKQMSYYASMADIAHNDPTVCSLATVQMGSKEAVACIKTTFLVL